MASLEELRENRIKKLANLKQAGINPYPSKSNRSFLIADALADFENLSQGEKGIIFAGRIMALRGQGALIFADLKDGSGNIQVLFKKDNFSETDFEKVSSILDLGDIIEAQGVLFTTKRGEKTLEAKNFKVLSKSLRPIPSEFYGLSDVEERYRRRYLDMLLNDGVKDKFVKRSKIISGLREFYSKEGYIEVETPILQTLAGGAIAKPFKTHLNALDLDLYLRVAPELYLKRLLVGGFEKVYEIGRCFRNEGMDATHNPDFTMFESYAAYQDYNDLMKIAERLMEFLIEKIYPGQDLNIEYKGQKISFKAPYKVVPFNNLLKEYLDIDYDAMSVEELLDFAKSKGLKLDPKMHKGKIADELYKEFIRNNIVQPIFMINHPLELSPLAKKMENDPTKVERLQLVVVGLEVMNGYSELNDPIDQNERFMEQERIRKSGDEEAQQLDSDYIEAMEYGMPPAAGLGIGVERLVMLLTDSQTLRESMLFPTMRPKSKE